MKNTKTFIHFFTFCTFLFLTLSLNAQYSAVMSEDLKKTIENQPSFRRSSSSAPQMMSALIKGDIGNIRNAVEAMGGKFKFSAGNIASVTVPMDRISELAAVRGVKRIEPSPKVRPMGDTMVVHNNITPVHNGASPLAQSYKGEGVLIGFLDSGIDWDHEDFRNEDGSSRIMAIWDQPESSPSKSPSKYGYGQYWTKADIDAGNCTHTERDPGNNFGHGTNIAGIAAGNGRAFNKYAGVAPEAHIAMVAVNNYQGTDDFLSDVADGVDFLFDLADSLGVPCVINTSIGTYTGARDGYDLTSQIIDSLLTEKDGRALVASAGNAGLYQYHLGYEVTADTNFTLFETNSTFTYFKLYTDTADFRDVHFAIGAYSTADKWRHNASTAYHNILEGGNFLQDGGGYHIEPLIDNNSGVTIANIYFYTELIGSKYYMSVYTVENPTYTADSTSNQFSLHMTGAGDFDIWSSKTLQGNASNIVADTSGIYNLPNADKYKFPDFDQTIVSSWQCSPNVITVGNFTNRKWYLNSLGDTTWNDADNIPGKIHKTSSTGPTRIGIRKPEIAASGDFTVTTADSAVLADWFASEGSKKAESGMHQRNGGTSSASPVVAGAIALFLQMNPTASLTEIRDALINNAKADEWTGTLPNDNFGYGKLDAFEMLSSTADTTCPFTADFALDTTCFGDSSLFISTSTSSDSSRQILNFAWDVTNNGSDNDTVSSDTFKFVYGSLGTKTVKLTISDHICSQTITKSGFLVTNNSIDLGSDTAMCGSDSIILDAGDHASYLWSTLETDSAITIQNADTIFVAATDANGCVARDTITISIFGASSDYQLRDDTTICSDATITITIDTAIYSNIAWNDSDSSISRGITDSGSYSFTALDTNNCIISSTTFNLDVNTIPDFTLRSDTSVCAGDTLPIAGPGNFVSYSWNNNSTKQNTNYLQAGNMILTVTDTNGCIGKDTAVLTHNTLPAVNIGANVRVCPGDSAYIISNITEGTLVWSTGDSTDTIVVRNNGMYTLTITDNNQCTAADTMYFSYHSIDFELDFSADPLGDAGVDFTNYTPNSDNYSFFWYFGDGNTSEEDDPEHTYTANGTFDITLIGTSDSIGCADTVIFEEFITIGNLEDCDHNAEITAENKDKNCVGDSVQLNATINNNLSFTYQWIKDGIEIDGATDRAYSARSGGEYQVMASDDGCQVYSNAISVVFSTDSVPATPTINSNGSLTNCSGSVVLDAGNYTDYSWSTDETDSSITVTAAGVYSVTVSNANNCTASGTITLSSASVSTPTICVFGFDSASQKTTISWSVSSADHIDSFVVYRETSTLNEYEMIGTVPSSELTYVDTTSNPKHRSDRYKIASKDECAVVQEQSEAHKSISTSIDKGNIVNTINWTSYEGIDFDSYIVYRGNHYNSLAPIDTVDDTTLTFVDSVINEHVFYQIGINATDDCDSINSRSNVVADSIIFINQEENSFTEFIQLYPNPNNGQFTIELNDIKEQNIVLEIYNLVGQKALEQNIELSNGSAQEIIDVSNFNSGLYFVRAVMTEDTYTQSIVIKK